MTYDHFKVKIKKLILIPPLLFLLIVQGCSSPDNRMNLDKDIYNEGYTIAKEINKASKENSKVLNFDHTKYKPFFDDENLTDENIPVEEKDFVYAIQELYINAVYSMSDDSYNDDLKDTKEMLKTKYGLNLK
ncbi:MAG: hypothetical protein ACI35O_16925 [Bacillaceae bacterium]